MLNEKWLLVKLKTREKLFIKISDMMLIIAMTTKGMHPSLNPTM